MDSFLINLNTPTESVRELNISSIEYLDDGIYLTIPDKGHLGMSVGQEVYYLRYIERDNKEVDAISSVAEIIEVSLGGLKISHPYNKVYSVKEIINTSNNDTRIVLSENHNIYQQDLDFAIEQKLYVYDINMVLIASASSAEFCIPLRYEDKKLTRGDCVYKIDELEGCDRCDDSINVYNYIFSPDIASKNGLLINSGISYNILSGASYVSFKYSPFFVQSGDSCLFYEDSWFDEIVDSDENECNRYNSGTSRTCIGVYDGYYKLDLGLSSDSDELSLGSEDSFGTSFIDTLIEEMVPSVIDMERVKYSPVYETRNQNNEITTHDATGLTFYLHFRERAKITDEERLTMNSVYTSGNVYYDSWHIDDEKREYTWWNGYDASSSIYMERFDKDIFTYFHEEHGKESDLIGYLNFTDNDVFYRKKKVGESFLRLSFYTSTDPIEQKLLYYSTIFLDEGELYGKYIKKLQELNKTEAYHINKRSHNSEINHNATVVMSTVEGTRVDSKIVVTNEYDKTKCSEGFNIYLFAQDRDFNFENDEKTIYMRVDFNHAGNGKTLPMIKWPKDRNGEFCALTTDNFVENIYIPVKLKYLNGRYVYSISVDEEDVVDSNVGIILYEPKLDMLSENDKGTSGTNMVSVIHVSPSSIIYDRTNPENNEVKVVSNTEWEFSSDSNISFEVINGVSGSSGETILRMNAPNKNATVVFSTTNNNLTGSDTAELKVYKSTSLNKPYLSVDVDEIILRTTGQTKNINITCNTKWKLTKNDDELFNVNLNVGEKDAIIELGLNQEKVDELYNDSYSSYTYSLFISTVKEDGFTDKIITKEVKLIWEKPQYSYNRINVIVNTSYAITVSNGNYLYDYDIGMVRSDGEKIGLKLNSNNNVKIGYGQRLSLSISGENISNITLMRGINSYELNDSNETIIARYDESITDDEVIELNFDINNVEYNYKPVFVGYSAINNELSGYNTVTISIPSDKTATGRVSLGTYDVVELKAANNDIINTIIYGAYLNNASKHVLANGESGNTIQLSYFNKLTPLYGLNNNLGDDVSSNVNDDLILGEINQGIVTGNCPMETVVDLAVSMCKADLCNPMDRECPYDDGEICNCNVKSTCTCNRRDDIPELGDKSIVKYTRKITSDDIENIKKSTNVVIITQFEY